MSTNAYRCPKCHGEMVQGFVLDSTHGGRLVPHWAAGLPEKSFWSGTHKPAGPLIPIGVFRCANCGLLESYARDDFAAR